MQQYNINKHKKPNKPHPSQNTKMLEKRICITTNPVRGKIFFIPDIIKSNKYKYTEINDELDNNSLSSSVD